MDLLEIPVTYNGYDQCLNGQVVRYGYAHRIVVDLLGIEITFERDEECNYRAIGDEEKLKNAKVDVQLVKEVIRVLQSL